MKNVKKVQRSCTIDVNMKCSEHISETALYQVLYNNPHLGYDSANDFNDPRVRVILRSDCR